MFSFLLEGEKLLFYPGNSVKVDNTQGIFVRSGNCLITDLLSVNKRYKSVLLFFTDNKIRDFIAKYKHIIPFNSESKNACPAFLFERNLLLNSSVSQLEQILFSEKKLSAAMLQLKFEEIMLCLLEAYPLYFADTFMNGVTNETNVLFKKIIESNINNNLSLQELAFLCNTSLSTFKRQFEKIYGIAPGVWLQKQRMQQAAFKLKHEQARPSDIYFEYGYENLSGFIQAFKKEFGMTPGAYIKENT